MVRPSIVPVKNGTPQSIPQDGSLAPKTWPKAIARLTALPRERSGGPLPNYPHHGRYMAFWNFVHRAPVNRAYDFWDSVNRNSHTFALPIFAGFTADTVVTFEEETTEVARNESFGKPVTPASLFEAQLKLRHCRQKQSPRPGT